MPFKMQKIIFFSEKNKLNRYVCLPYLKFQTRTRNTLIFLFGIMDQTSEVQKTYKKIEHKFVYIFLSIILNICS